MNPLQLTYFAGPMQLPRAPHTLATSDFSWALDGWIILTAILAAISTALLGNFLILRKMSLLGDAISHAVLPGLAVAFFLSNSRNSIWMFLGAVVVGFLTAVFTEWIRGVGKVDEGASMGVVFTSLFALGLVMIVQAADNVDLDPGCVLYGAIELTPLDTVSVLGIEIPRVVLTLGAVLVVNLIFVVVFFKELKLSSFDALSPHDTSRSNGRSLLRERWQYSCCCHVGRASMHSIFVDRSARLDARTELPHWLAGSRARSSLSCYRPRNVGLP